MAKDDDKKTIVSTPTKVSGGGKIFYWVIGAAILLAFILSPGRGDKESGKTGESGGFLDRYNQPGAVKIDEVQYLKINNKESRRIPVFTGYTVLCDVPAGKLVLVSYKSHDGRQSFEFIDIGGDKGYKRPDAPFNVAYIDVKAVNDEELTLRVQYVLHQGGIPVIPVTIGPENMPRYY